MTDIETLKAADRAGRLYVPTRSLSGDDIPRPYVIAPVSRYRAMHDAYRAALDASIQAAGGLDEIALAARTPSMALALARAAVPVQAHRRLRLDPGRLNDPQPASPAFFRNSRAYTGKVESLERAIAERHVSDPVILLRATAIDNAARRLIIEAENMKSGSGVPDTQESRQHPARGAAELAAQDFPHGPAGGPPADIQAMAPGSPATPVPAPRTGSRAKP